MLYLKSLSLGRFKSFKHANLLFKNGFNCVVGPNGSGKSNICDAILFGLGESSLRRLRVKRLEDLISARKSKSRPGYLAKSYVRLEFSGDEDITLVRGAREDGKTAYRLNGKRMTRQEVLEVLKKHGVHSDETSTIAQGEINKLIELNPKERRELLELASGIKEFEYKRAEAMSELEKVSAKVGEAQVLLGERTAFLKELEKEKLAAESYLAMTKRLRALNYSVLVSRSKAVQLALDGYSKDAAALAGKRKAADSELAALSDKSAKLSEERQGLTKLLSESSGAISEINKKLEEIGRELSALDVTMAGASSAAEEAVRRAAEARKSAKEADATIGKNDTELKSLNKQIAALESGIKKIGAAQSGTEAAAKAERLKAESDAVQALEQEVAALQKSASELGAARAAYDATKSACAKDIESLQEELDAAAKSVSQASESAKGLDRRKEHAQSQLKKTEASIAEVNAALSKAESDVISLKEQRAMSRPRDFAMRDRLKSEFGKGSGFHGTAAELCSYEAKHAPAIEAAAGGRFSYFVVDSVGVAGTIIDYLKKQNLGRATFIPLQELVTEGSKRKPEAVAGATPMVGLLNFEAKFGKVFDYLFNDTYLVDSIMDAKRLGIGGRRYATITGETVERSGVLSGGSATKAASLASLDRRLSELEAERLKLRGDSSRLGEVAFELRKELAAVEMESGSLRASAADSESRIKDLGARADRSRADLAAADSKLSKADAELRQVEKELKSKSDALAKGRRSLTVGYGETLKESAALAMGGAGTKEFERLESVRKEAEGLKIRSAELQKESKMLEQSRDALLAEAKSKEEEAAKSRSSIVADSKRKAELEKARAGIEHEIKSSSKSNKDAYERLDAIESELLSLSKEQGRLNAGVEEIARKVSELEVKKGQMGVRLADIKAELGAYGDMESEIVKEEVERMEKETVSLSAKISDLGSVNMKAPEIYAEKRKSVEEAAEKVGTLEAERRSVLAMIDEISSKKLNAFMTTFDEVNKNFSRLYGYIFAGTAVIELQNQASPLEGGVEIRIEDGRSRKRVDALSGGQKSLISLMLLFAIHMCKPSAMYIFDEIDAALDKENSKKLSQLIKELAKQAQFIVVSHNDSLIVNADVAIGVVKAEDESKVVGIEISSMKNA